MQTCQEREHMHTRHTSIDPARMARWLVQSSSLPLVLRRNVCQRIYKYPIG